MLKLNYFLADIFILSAEKQPIKLSWRKIEWLQNIRKAPLLRKSLFGYFVLIAVIICMAAVCIHEHISDYGLNSLIRSLKQGVFDVSYCRLLL